ncbi:hypothetical protein [Oceanisphaera sp. KMM 10153]|uniref:hypothetical protein n=1 Tax=Oceanisphaera submarina TaxID=3390193 RepID=UPI003974B96C
MYKVLPLFFLAALTGCTNSVSDEAKYLYPDRADDYSTIQLFDLAREFVINKDYRCEPSSVASYLQCTKYTRQWDLHTTKVIMKIVRDHDDGSSILIFASRWDEGLIPGEFISNTFHSEDLAELCRFFEGKGIATCKNSSS